MLPNELALRVIDQRKRLKLSQATVGKLVGLKQQTVSDFENNPERAHVDTLLRILAAIDLDILLVVKENKIKWKEEW